MSEKLAQVFLIVFTSMFVFTLTVCKAAPMGDYIQDTEELTNSASAVGQHLLLFTENLFFLDYILNDVVINSCS